MKYKVIILILLQQCCGPAQGEVREKVYTSHYFVTPMEGESLQEALRAESPVSRDGNVYYGQTEWTVRPGFRYISRGNLCYISDVQVFLKVKFTLPKLQLANSDEKIEGRFDIFYKALLEHEYGHHALGQEAANKVAKLLKNMTPHYRCESLADNAKTEIHNIIKRYKSRNREYDQATQFGRTQGAVIK